MGGLFSKSKPRREEVWRQESVFENRLYEDQQRADTWGGVTSYNLLDIHHQGGRDINSAPQHKPLESRYGNVQERYDYNFGDADDYSACPTNYRPNPAKPPIDKNYYSSPKKVKGKSRNTTTKNRPEWKSDIDSNRKTSINSELSTVDLHENSHQEPRQTFKTINPSKNMREPSKPSSKNNRSSSLPSINLKSPSKHIPEDYSYLDKYKPPPQYMTNKERQELLKIKQEKERNNNNLKYESTKKAYQSQPVQQRSPTKSVKTEPKPSPKKSVSNRPDPSKVYSVPSKKVKGSTLDAPKSKSEPTSKSTSRNSSTSNNPYTDLNGIKSEKHSAVSTVSNFNLRTKVISFNDKKQSLGSIGMASITKLDNNFKVRQFPDGGKQGLSNAIKLLDSDDWERNVEGLEMLASLARQHPEVLESDSKTIRNILLKSVKNLRSQVCRAAVQAVAVVFLYVGKSLEFDSDNLIKELLQKSADTNKFLRLHFGRKNF